MSKQAHPLYGYSLIVNITTVIAQSNTGGELTISAICDQLITKFPQNKIDRKALARRIRDAVNTLAHSKTINTQLKQTPQHRLPYIIILT
jgi:hypothetical protein